MTEARKGKRAFQALAIVLAAVAALTAAFFIYTGDYYHADSVAAQAMQSGSGVTVTQGKNLMIFKPDGAEPQTGFIFYPGGKVEADAYAPLLRAVASHGYACVLLKVPFNLAVFDVNGADRAIAALPNITTWYVGGHSLGGSMACAWLANNTSKCAGVVLLGSYTANDLSATTLRALTIVGGKDGVLNRDALDKSKDKLPDGALYVEIDGGNHAQFGSYGAQKGDGKADISAVVQQSIAARAIADFFANTQMTAAQPDGSSPAFGSLFCAATSAAVMPLQR